MAEEPNLPVKTVRIACELSSGSHNTVAGNNDTDRIAAYSLPHSLRGHFIFSHTRCHFPGDCPVGSCLSEGNGAEYFPYLLLEWRTGQLNGKIRIIRFSKEIAVQPIPDGRKDRKLRIGMFPLRSKKQACQILSVAFKPEEAHRRRIICTMKHVSIS